MQKALEIINYFNPERLWLETPKYGLLPKQGFMANLPYWDVDYCQYGDGGLGNQLGFLAATTLPNFPLYYGVNFANLGAGRRHLRPLGWHWAATKARSYPIPAPIVEIASGLRSQEGKVRTVGNEKRVRFISPPSPLSAARRQEVGPEKETPG